MNTVVARFETHPDTGMTHSNFTPPDAFSTSDKTENNHFYYASDDESILTGVWECAPCREVIDAYSVNEMMTILSGSVTVTNSDNGQAETFTTGDTFFIAKGSSVVWEITETLRKYYLIAA